MADTKYANTRANLVNTGGGSVRMTISSNVAQGNAGTSLPCKSVYLVASAATVRVTIGTTCTSTTGIPLPWREATGANAGGIWGALKIDIDDVSKLYFYGSGGTETIDCLYVY